MQVGFRSGNDILKQYSLDEWRELGRAFYDVRLKTAKQHFSANADFHLAGRSIITNVQFSPLMLARDPKRIRGFDHEYLLFERYEKGEGRGVVGETSTRINEHTLHLIDMSQKYATSTTQVVGSGILIPHDLVGYDPSRDPHYVSVRRDLPRARLLEAAFDAIFASLGEGNFHETNVLVGAFAGLVQRLLLGHQKDTDLQQTSSTVNLAMRDFIESQLANPELDTLLLCSKFGLSRSSLYRRFHDDGGVECYISGRRLDRCFRELCATAPSRGRVKTIANRWGFADLGNFNRRFRNRFDVAPTECLDQGAMVFAPNAEARDQNLIHYWMRQNRH